MSATEPHGPDEQGAPQDTSRSEVTAPLQQPAATAHPTGYTPAPAVPAAPGTNAMAILSMVSSILGLTFVPFVGSIIGVVTGHIARRQIRETGQQGHGPATAGVAIGYVGIAIALVALIVLVLALVVFRAPASA